MNKNIISIFKSLQGEGFYIGFPSLFIRFGGKCNLADICYFCDTKYTQIEKPKLSTKDAVDFIRNNYNYRHIIITGSEPLMYQSDIIEILNSLSHEELSEKQITIETNCSIKPKESLNKIMQFYDGLWSVSPKLITWKNWHLDTISHFNTLPNTIFKFVIDIPIEDEIKKVLSLFSLKKITKSYVILQPNGNRKDYNEACRELADYVVNNNLIQFRTLPQFHKICWNNQRGK